MTLFGFRLISALVIERSRNTLNQPKIAKSLNLLNLELLELFEPNQFHTPQLLNF
jgi:hypothetical protein